MRVTDASGAVGEFLGHARSIGGAAIEKRADLGLGTYPCLRTIGRSIMADGVYWDRTKNSRSRAEREVETKKTSRLSFDRFTSATVLSGSLRQTWVPTRARAEPRRLHKMCADHHKADPEGMIKPPTDRSVDTSVASRETSSGSRVFGHQRKAHALRSAAQGLRIHR